MRGGLSPPVGEAERAPDLREVYALPRMAPSGGVRGRGSAVPVGPRPGYGEETRLGHPDIGARSGVLLVLRADETVHRRSPLLMQAAHGSGRAVEGRHPCPHPTPRPLATRAPRSRSTLRQYSAAMACTSSVTPPQVVVPLFRVELDGEAPGVPNGVGRSQLAGNGREAHEHRGSLRRPVEERGLRPLGHVLGDLEEPVSAAALAWTTRSGIRSLLNCAIFWMR
jgi:hypothetical protein